MKSGGSSAMFPPVAGGDGREGARLVSTFEHLGPGAQARSRSRLSRDAMLSVGRSGIVTAQPASIPDAAIARMNFTIELGPGAGPKCSKWSLPPGTAPRTLGAGCGLIARQKFMNAQCSTPSALPSAKAVSKYAMERGSGEAERHAQNHQQGRRATIWLIIG